MATVHRKGRGFVEKKPDELGGLFGSDKSEASKAATQSKTDAAPSHKASRMPEAPSKDEFGRVQATSGDSTKERDRTYRSGSKRPRSDDEHSVHNDSSRRRTSARDRSLSSRSSYSSGSDRGGRRRHDRRGYGRDDYDRRKNDYNGDTKRYGDVSRDKRNDYRSRDDDRGYNDRYRRRSSRSNSRRRRSFSRDRGYNGPKHRRSPSAERSAPPAPAPSVDNAASVATSAVIAKGPAKSLEEQLREHRAAFHLHAVTQDETYTKERQVTLLYGITTQSSTLDAIKSEVRSAVNSMLATSLISRRELHDREVSQESRGLHDREVPQELRELHDYLLRHAVLDVSGFPYPGGVELLVETHSPLHTSIIVNACATGSLDVRGVRPTARSTLPAAALLPQSVHSNAVEEWFPYVIANQKTAEASEKAAAATKKAAEDDAPSAAIQRSFFPQLGSAITVSNFKKNAAIIASGAHSTSGAVTDDLLAQLRSRISSNTLQFATGQSSAPSKPADNSAKTDNREDYAVKSSSQSANSQTQPKKEGNTTATATTTAASSSSSFTSEEQPLLGMQSSTVTLPFPNGLTGMVSVGPLAAITAGLTGPGGVINLMASVITTPVLAISNALTDADLANPAELADIVADFAIECRKLLGSQGNVLAIRVPKPKSAKDTVDIVFERPVKLKTDGLSIGGIALLEDARPKDRSKAIPTTANSFFAKALGKGGANVGAPGGIGSVSIAGLLTNGGAGSNPALASTFGAAGATYSSFYQDTAANANGANPAISLPSEGLQTRKKTTKTGVGADGTQQAQGVGGKDGNDDDDNNDDEEEEEGDDGAGYDPLAGRIKGVGKLFIECSSTDAAVLLQKELSGRAFAGRILVTTFVNDKEYDAGKVCDFAAC